MQSLEMKMNLIFHTTIECLNSLIIILYLFFSIATIKAKYIFPLRELMMIRMESYWVLKTSLFFESTFIDLKPSSQFQATHK